MRISALVVALLVEVLVEEERGDFHVGGDIWYQHSVVLREVLNIWLDVN